MRLQLEKFLAVLFIFTGPMFLFVPTSHASTISYFKTFYNTDWTYAGVGGVRGGDNNAIINLSGVSGTVTQALLYWHGPTNSPDPNVNSTIRFNGNTITGVNIGTSSDNCWGYMNSQAYRADVTSLVTGNGSYEVSDFIKANADINGFSLLTFFDDGNPANNRDVVIFDGNDSSVNNIYDDPGWNVELKDINYTSGTVSMVLGVADGQKWDDGALICNGVVITTGSSIFQGDSVPDDGTASATWGTLWDIKEFDVTSQLTPGLNTLTLTSSQYFDCLSLIHVAIDLPAGAAPPEKPEVVPEPGTLILLGSGIIALTARCRAKKTFTQKTI